jgi:RNA polymerase sigma factor (sigma-70 family)
MATLRALDFDTYFRLQYPKLVAELDYILGDADLARDVAQDAFVRQCVSWARLSRHDKPGAWVRRVALRMAFRKRRKMAREVAIDESQAEPDSDTDSVRRLDVRRAILQLSDQQRSAVVLHYYRDFPINEVAQIMGCKEPTAKVHLHNARKRLAELLVVYKPQ